MEELGESLLGVGAFVFSFLFSLLEGALLFYSRSRLEAIFDARGAEGVPQRLQQREGELVLACRIGNLLANLVLVAVLALYFQRLFGAAHGGYLLAVLGSGLLVVVVGGELIPLGIGQWWPEWVLLRGWRVAFATGTLLRPLTRAAGAVGRFALRVAGARRREIKEEVENEILEAAEEGARHGVIDTEELSMIASVMALGELPVSKAMTPRTEIKAVAADVPVEEAIRLARECGHSRIPVHGGDLDRVVGVLYVKDVLFAAENGSLPEKKAGELARAAYFVPETTPLPRVLSELRARKTHVAIVVDEYGGTSGLVTLEDVLEEVVGEIEDEYDPQEAEVIKELSGGEWLMHGRAELEDVREATGLALRSETEAETVAGLVMERLGRVPRAGDKVEIDGAVMEVVEADARRVVKVHVSKKRVGGGSK